MAVSSVRKFSLLFSHPLPPHFHIKKMKKRTAESGSALSAFDALCSVSDTEKFVVRKYTIFNSGESVLGNSEQRSTNNSIPVFEIDGCKRRRLCSSCGIPTTTTKKIRYLSKIPVSVCPVYRRSHRVCGSKESPKSLGVAKGVGC